ncbi:hypothetical protein HK103_006345 [Boothiomyces macroporosus]|uniref:Uncharacterized protein n=1 Tax=Boothiomyces macroporosus TaxID=261099 RepID=A0AAD5UE63_9FUNG|nr:hypothetical protein HK103_006345 [Boothiomyces macroporosus]
MLCGEPHVSAQPQQKPSAPKQDPTQQLFSAFQNAAPAVTSKPSATEQLFEAFQSAPVAQPPKNSKDSILSLYSNPPPTNTTAQSTGFAAFQPQSTFSPTNSFMPPNQQQNLGLNSFGNFGAPNSTLTSTPSFHSTQNPAPTEFGAFADFQTPATKTTPKDPFADFGNFGTTSTSNNKPKDDWSAFE